MKKIISATAVIFCLVLFAGKAYAQGNLQFNQVITIIVSANTTSSFTVPAGKVWKIESAGLGGGSSSSLILRDASALPIAYFYGGSNITPFPFWLPSSFSGSFQSTGTNPYRAVISIVEFNVVP